MSPIDVASCPLCSPESRCTVRFRKYGYIIHRCCECNLLFVHPRPSLDEIMELYNADYFKRGNKYSCNQRNRELDPNRQNDLGKISKSGSVKPQRLFKVERYETLLQMVSGVKSVLKSNVGIYDLFKAIFPSGSVTGAPKISTMKIIKIIMAP